MQCLFNQACGSKKITMVYLDNPQKDRNGVQKALIFTIICSVLPSIFILILIKKIFYYKAKIDNKLNNLEII